MAAKLTKIEAGKYEYKGYNIYRTSHHSNAYNPWKISLIGRSFVTLAEARKYIDSKTTPEEMKVAKQISDYADLFIAPLL